jgi:hypothetical protein
MAEVLYRVELPHVNFGMLVRDGVVVDVAAAAYWAKTKTISEVLAWVEKQGGQWHVVSEGQDTPREEFVDAYVSCMPSTPPAKAAEIFDMLRDEKTDIRRRLSEAIKAVRKEK